MKNNKLFMIIFVFVMFFCVNIDSALALDDRGGGGSVTSYSYGVVCSYGGVRKWTTGKSSTIGGGTVEQNYPYTFTLKVNCNNSSCDKLDVSTYGLVKDQDGSKKEIKINNYNSLGNMINENSSKFGFKKGKGVTTCPDKVGFEWETLTNFKLDKVDEFGNFLLNSTIYKQASLESSYRFYADNAKNVDIKEETDSSISKKKRTTTDTTDTGENSSSNEIENDNQSGSNAEEVEGVHNAADRWNYNQTITSEDGTIQCTELLGDANIEIIKTALLIMAVIGIVLVVAFGISDFVKAIASSDDDALKQAGKHVKNRIISVIVLLLLPVLVDFVLGFINDNLYFQKVDKDGNLGEEIHVKVGKVSDCAK